MCQPRHRHFTPATEPSPTTIQAAEALHRLRTAPMRPITVTIPPPPSTPPRPHTPPSPPPPYAPNNTENSRSAPAPDGWSVIDLTDEDDLAVIIFKDGVPQYIVGAIAPFAPFILRTHPHTLHPL